MPAVSNTPSPKQTPLSGRTSSPNELVSTLKSELREQGALALRPDQTFQIIPEWKDTLSEIQSLAALPSYNRIRIAYDASFFYSRAHLFGEIKGENYWKDQLIDSPSGARLRELLLSDSIVSALQSLTDKPIILKEARFNKMEKNDIIGLHQHPEQLQAILTIEEAIEGGAYYATRESMPPLFEKFPAGTLVMNDGQFEEVHKVTEGTRFSFVYAFQVVNTPGPGVATLLQNH